IASLGASRPTRCTTSAISSTGSTSARIRFSSPSFSNFFTNSLKSAYATVLSSSAALYHEPKPIPLSVEPASSPPVRQRGGRCSNSYRGAPCGGRPILPGPMIRPVFRRAPPPDVFTAPGFLNLVFDFVAPAWSPPVSGRRAVLLSEQDKSSARPILRNLRRTRFKLTQTVSE